MIGGTAVETPAGAAHDDDDTQLVMAVQGGDESAAAVLFMRYRGLMLLWGAAGGAVGPDLEDAVQDALLTMWERLPAFEQRRPGGFRRWAFLILRAKRTDRVRRRRTYDRTLRDLSHWLDGTAVPSGGVAVLSRAVRCVTKAREQLHHEGRGSIIEAMEARGDHPTDTHAELAARLHVPVPALQYRLGVARRLLLEGRR